MVLFKNLIEFEDKGVEVKGIAELLSQLIADYRFYYAFFE
jgi:hypothetical protein